MEERTTVRIDEQSEGAIRLDFSGVASDGRDDSDQEPKADAAPRSDLNLDLIAEPPTKLYDESVNDVSADEAPAAAFPSVKLSALEPMSSFVESQPAPESQPASAGEPLPASYVSLTALEQPVPAASAQPQTQPQTQPQSQPQAQPQQQQPQAQQAQSQQKPAMNGAADDQRWNADFQRASQLMHRIVDNVGTVIFGKDEVIELVLLAVIARGHVLIEDLPGTGKTSLVSALSKSISCVFHRIQFTPDVMPSDVTGFSVFNQKTREFEFRPGGVMANIVLADEINRASAKTQSSLLEAMEERQVTVDSNTYKLDEPFMVLATQNPIEQFGTYPLPEAQVDRFLVKTSIGYPEFAQEERIIEEGRASKQAIRPVATQGDIVRVSAVADRVYIGPHVRRYIVEIVSSTRNSPDIQVGASPRGTIALSDLARAYALYQGRSYVIPDDVKHLARYALCHRIQLSHSASIEGRSAQDVIDSIISGIAVPFSADDAKRESNEKGGRA